MLGYVCRIAISDRSIRGYLNVQFIVSIRFRQRPCARARPPLTGKVRRFFVKLSEVHMNPKSAKLQQLIHRKDQALAVMHTPTAAFARVMEEAGAETGFVGTNSVVGGYTGLSDVGTLSMTECLLVSKWIANSVQFPVIMDGDTGHGGIMAVRRMVRECIEAGIAGVRIDDQPIEGKRRTQSVGMEVVPLEQAVVRYRAAVDMKNELDPNFVVMAQCYARVAANGGFEDR
jgi:2-methylisocitrate lyase-like PEP mutase family enzyme